MHCTTAPIVSCKAPLLSPHDSSGIGGLAGLRSLELVLKSCAGADVVVQELSRALEVRAAVCYTNDAVMSTGQGLCSFRPELLRLCLHVENGRLSETCIQSLGLCGAVGTRGGRGKIRAEVHRSRGGCHGFINATGEAGDVCGDKPHHRQHSQWNQ